MAKVIEEEGRLEDPDSLESQIREYVKAKSVIEIMDSRTKMLRDKLFARMEEEGQEDANGNLQLFLPDVIEGVTRLEKQRRASRKLNEARAEEIANELGIYDDLFEMKPVLQEDSLMAAFYEGKLTEDQLDEMFPVNVTWALRTVKK
jgi:hypothetical protein